MLILHLFVSYAHVNLCHFFSFSSCQGLAATSACGSSWTFLFTLLADSEGVPSEAGVPGALMGWHGTSLLLPGTDVTTRDTFSKFLWIFYKNWLLSFSRRSITATNALWNNI